MNLFRDNGRLWNSLSVPFDVFYQISVFPSSCALSQLIYRPLKSAGTLENHLVIPLQPKFETGKLEPYRPPTLPWYPFDAHFKDKEDNGPPFTPISVWNAKKGQNSGELMNLFRDNGRLWNSLSVPFDVFYQISVFPSSCDPSQLRYRPLKSAGTLEATW